MAVPYDTSLLVNLLRESCVSVNLNTTGSSKGNSSSGGLNTGGNGSSNYMGLNEIHSRILDLYETRLHGIDTDPLFYQKNFPKLFNASKNSPPIEVTFIPDNDDNDRFNDSKDKSLLENELSNTSNNKNNDTINAESTPKQNAIPTTNTITSNDTSSSIEISKDRETHSGNKNGKDGNSSIANKTNNSIGTIEESVEKIPLPKRTDSLSKKQQESKRRSSVMSLAESVDSTSSSSSLSTKSSSTTAPTTASTNPKQKQQGLFNLTRLIRPVVRHSSTSSTVTTRGQRTQTIQEESEEDVANVSNNSGNIPFINSKKKGNKLFRREESLSDSSDEDDEYATETNNNQRNNHHRHQNSKDDASNLASSYSSKMSRDTTFNSTLDESNYNDDTTNLDAFSNADDDQLSGSFEAATSDEEFMTTDNDFNGIDSDDILNGINDSSMLNSEGNLSDQSSDFNFNDELDSDSFSQDSDYIPEADESLDGSSTPLLYKRGLRLPDIPSVSKISFRSRANTTTGQMNKYVKHNSMISNTYQNTPPIPLQSTTGASNLLTSKRKPPPISSTINSNNLKPMNFSMRNSKSTSNMLSLATTSTNAADNEIKQQIESKLFEQSIVKRDLSSVTPKYPQKSSLSALIDSVNNPLTVYEHIGSHIKPERKTRRRDLNKKNADLDDNMFQISVYLENINSTPIYFKILKSAKVVDLIGLALFTIQNEKETFNKIDLSKIPMNPNHWSLFVSDDGELLDDFGVLDRRRQLMSYGTDEFAMVVCSDEEAKKNEKLTPTITDFNDNLHQHQHQDQLQSQGSPTTQLRSVKKSPVVTQMGTMGTLGTLKVGGELKNTLIATDVTPVSSVNKQNEITPYFGGLNNQTDPNEKSNKHRTYDFDLDDSDDEARVTTESRHKNSQKDSSRIGVTLLGNEATKNGIENGGHHDHNELDDFRRFPTRRQSFSQLAKPNIDNASSKLNKLMNNKSLSSIWHNTINDQDSNSRSNAISDINNHDRSVIDVALPTLYHRWSVWRRQQVSFKNRVERSLAVDGFEIYILPFSENRGSWNNNAKTSSFHVTQITKCKQSSKVPYQFKIYVNKSGTLKRYYLEAVNANQCKEIVMTIQSLMKAYKAES